MKQIKFKAQGANSAIGAFNNGDIARVDGALAKHLVEEAKVAVFVEADPPKAAEIEPKKPKAKRAKE